MRRILPVVLMFSLVAAGCNRSALMGSMHAPAGDPSARPGPEATRAEPDLPEWLHVSPSRAYMRWQANPKGVHILDVRTPAEYFYVGHAPMARNIPVRLLVHKWDPTAKRPAMRPNPSFMAAVRKACRPGDTILVMSRAGGRGAEAVSLMRTAGFTDVHNITGGFEGVPRANCACPDVGKRTVNGWKNSSLAWTYDLKRELMYLP